jgi:hypothetical protein
MGMLSHHLAMLGQELLLFFGTHDEVLFALGER